MGADYIPQQELAMNRWAANFVATIAAAPAAYALSDADASALTAAQEAFSAALTRAVDPVTRTKPSVADKEDKKAALLTLLRRYAQILKHKVSDPSKVSLGLTVDRAGKTRHAAPATAPVLTLQRLEHLRHTLGYADADLHPAKPRGVMGLQLFRRVGDPAAPPEYVGMFTQQPIRLPLEGAGAGQIAYYHGCWATRTGLTGPPSAVVEAPIVA